MRVLALVLLLAGCGAPTPQFPREDVPATTSAEVIGAAPTTTRVPYKPVDHDVQREMARTACESGVPYNSTSTPYGGPGPHPLDGYEVTDHNSHMQHSPVFMGYVPGDVNVIQLVACVVAIPGNQSGTVTCKFDTGVSRSRTWPLLEATYEITVREARTGRVVTTLNAVGDDTPENSCPSFAADHADATVARSLADETLAKTLDPIRHGPAK